jgi:hypothetical protein
MVSRRFLNWSDKTVELWMMISPDPEAEDYLFQPVSASQIKTAIKYVSSIEETMELLGINQQLLELSMLAWLEDKWGEDDEDKDRMVYGPKLVLGIRETNEWQYHTILKLSVPEWLFFMSDGMTASALFGKNQGVVLLGNNPVFHPNLWVTYKMTPFSKIVSRATMQAFEDAEKETS